VEACTVTLLQFEDHRAPEHVRQAQETSSKKADQGTIGNDTHMNCWFIDEEIEWWQNVSLAIVCVEASFCQIQSQLRCQ